MCLPMPTDFYILRWNFDADMGRFAPRQNKTHSFEIMVVSYFELKRSECTIESFNTAGRRKISDCFNVDGFRSDCNTVFKAMGCFLSLLSLSESTSFSH